MIQVSPRDGMDRTKPVVDATDEYSIAPIRSPAVEPRFS
jgi:hypothetical protein